MVSDPALLEGETHHDALERLAVDALSRGDIKAAFRYADRRCRIPPLADAHHYTLRAEALYRMGDQRGAVADVRRAREIAPADLGANRRMFAWANGASKTDAARALLAHEHDVHRLVQPIKHLGGDDPGPFCAITVLDDCISGWAAWQAPATLEIEISSGTELSRTSVDSDPKHALAEVLGHAATFTIERPRSQAPQRVRLSVGDTAFRVFEISANEPGAHVPAPGATTPTMGEGAEGDLLTVVVPVYGDFRATKACLDSLTAQFPTGPDRHIVVVVDASPDRRIKALVARLAGQSGLRVLTNPSNLGFVGSVNRALGEISDGDVILLNSDTIVPPRFDQRLAAAARSSPDIGTATPLSNNGEFTSFPMPNTANPLGSPSDTVAIDALAAEVNRDQIIDIPNGIGFCLYITRRCLDAVGALSARVFRGYLEDVDFCLRARERGFRNVCVPSVYVGHAGSRSFGREKRELVVRNLKVIESRFPRYRAECAAFLEGDPLRGCRQAIERASAPEIAGARILVTGRGPVAAVAWERARQLAAAGPAPLVMQVINDRGGARITIRRLGGAMPQSLNFDLTNILDCRALAEYLDRMEPSRVELIDPAGIPAELLDIVAQPNRAIDLFVADCGLVCACGRASWNDGDACVGDGAGHCPSPHQPAATDSRSDAKDVRQRRERWRSITRSADTILAPSRSAEAFARRFLTERTITCLQGARQTRPAARHTRGRDTLLGFLPVTGSAKELRAIRSVSRMLRSLHPNASAVVIGETLDDLSLLRLGNTFVSGPVGRSEYALLLRRYGVRAICLPFRRPLFGHPVIDAARASRLPVAYFDWSFQRLDADDGDLPLAPPLSDDEMTTALASWLGRMAS